MGEFMGELVFVKGKPTNRISNRIKKKEIQDTARHFLVHTINVRLWEELHKGTNDKTPQEQIKELSGAEDEVVMKLHSILANSNCECESNSYMKFKSAAIWKIGSTNFKTLATYSCPNCKGIKQMEAEFKRGKLTAWINRVLKR